MHHVLASSSVLRGRVTTAGDTAPDLHRVHGIPRPSIVILALNRAVSMHFAKARSSLSRNTFILRTAAEAAPQTDKARSASESVSVSVSVSVSERLSSDPSSIPTPTPTPRSPISQGLATPRTNASAFCHQRLEPTRGDSFVWRLPACEGCQIRNRSPCDCTSISGPRSIDSLLAKIGSSHCRKFHLVARSRPVIHIQHLTFRCNSVETIR
jgi:hypothetical protein